MADLYVDVDALTELSRQLGQVKAALEQTNNDVSRSSESFGSARLSDAIGSFVDGWQDGRKHLINDVGSLLDKINTAVNTYQDQETQLSKAARGQS